MTYGKHQEAVSRALRDLLEHGDSTLDPESPWLVLECRDHAITALRDRLRYLGATEAAESAGPVRVNSIARRPLQHLAGILDRMHRADIAATAPSDLLPGPPAKAADTVVDRWRSVARDLVLGTAELSTATRQPWVFRAEATWYVVADAASTVEALLVLDHTFAESGLIPPRTAESSLSNRLVAGDVAKIARWYGTDNAADLATAGMTTQVGLCDGPRIHMVRNVEDYASAQRTLAGFIYGDQASADTGTPQERPGLLVARAVSTGQFRLAEAFARWAEQETSGVLLAEQFRARKPTYKALYLSTTRLTEIEQRKSPLALAQQSEMIMQMRIIGGTRPSRATLVDLNDATHELTVAVGKGLRREGRYRKNIQALESRGVELPVPRVLSNSREPFHAACKALAVDRVSPPELSRWAAPVEREQLRTMLDHVGVGNPNALRMPPPGASRGGRGVSRSQF